MRTKKSIRVNLEKKRHLFFLLGLTVTLVVILAAFEWHADTKTIVLPTSNWEPIDEVLIPIIREKELPLPKLKKKKIIVFEVVENNPDIEIPDVELANTEELGEAVEAVDVVEEVPMEPEVDDSVIPFAIIEEKPEFIGGEAGVLAFIAQNIKYPELAKEIQIQGVVYVEFVVGKDGSVKDVVLKRGVDPLLDKEALRVVQMMPKWKPGKQRGQVVNVSYIIPIRFKLVF